MSSGLDLGRWLRRQADAYRGEEPRPLGVATHKLSRLLSKDAVTSPLRAPFVRYKEPAGPAELHEEVREHAALERLATGES